MSTTEGWGGCGESCSNCLPISSVGPFDGPQHSDYPVPFAAAQLML